MTSKHKTPTTAAKKRPAADQRKPVKAAAAEKTVAHAATVREKDHRPKSAAAPRKTATAAEPMVAAPAPPPAPTVVEPTRPVDGKNGASAKPPADKKVPLGIERRVPGVGEDRQSQLKLLIARGKEQ